ncbi:MAG: PspC domain-containing protein [Propionibacteriales bacterium]|nr:PspC domain-containing protein [Propionibacteriales bacterium]
MSQTTEDPNSGSPQQQTLPPPHQDLDRLRRSVSDRYIAGVAGGLGRHFNIDPTVIRVLLAVLTLFGGAGVLIYAVCWFFVPEEGKEKATINIGTDARKILLLAAAGIALLLAIGDSFNGFGAGWPIASIAVVIAVVVIARDKRAVRRAQPGTDWNQYAQQVSQQVTDQVTERVNEQMTQQYGTGQAPPAWYPSAVTPPLLPPHPKRTGILWFWPTLALIAIALGTVGIIDQTSQVTAGVYPAVALGVTGVMLLVGSFVGRPGGLILLGIVSTVALAAATVLGTFNFDGRNLEANPLTSTEVQSEYEVHMGRIQLDLTDVADVEALAGREIDLHLNAGEITVIVPRSLNVQINAETGFAGGIKIPGYDGGGIEDQASRTITGSPANTLPPLELDLEVRVGQITVEQR